MSSYPSKGSNVGWGSLCYVCFLILANLCCSSTSNSLLSCGCKRVYACIPALLLRRKPSASTGVPQLLQLGWRSTALQSAALLLLEILLAAHPSKVRDGDIEPKARLLNRTVKWRLFLYSTKPLHSYVSK